MIPHWEKKYTPWGTPISVHLDASGHADAEADVYGHTSREVDGHSQRPQEFQLEFLGPLTTAILPRVIATLKERNARRHV